MRRIAVPVLLLPLALLVACGSGSPDGQAAVPSASATAAEDLVALPADDAVMIRLDAGDGTEPVVYTLACADPSASGSGAAVAVPGPGSLPEPEAACAQLRSQPEPFAPLPDDVMCTQLFGGPQTALVAGTWAGQRVDLQLSRTDGCRIAQWDRLGALLPGPTG